MSLEGKTAPDSVIRGKLHKLIIDKTLTMAGAAADAAATGARIDEFQDEVDELKKQASTPYDAVKRSGDTMYGDLAFEFDGVVYNNYDEHNKPTPEAIGAVKKTGDTMTGALSLRAGANIVGTVNDVEHISLEKIDSAGDKPGRFFDLYSGGSWVSRFGLTAEGLTFWSKALNAYNNIYHTGNKPTAADVGAAIGMGGSIRNVDLLEWAKAQKATISVFANPGSANITNCPSTYAGYATAMVSLGSSVTLLYVSPYEKKIYYNETSGGNWVGWETITRASDLAKYLPVTGGVMTGPLVIDREWPEIGLTRAGTDTTQVIFGAAGHLGQIVVMNEKGNTNNSRSLQVVDSTNMPEVSKSVVLVNKVNGTSTYYTLYGTHNKPTPADIGAATDKPFEVTETTIAEDVDTYTISDLNCQEAILDFQVSGGGEDELSLNLYINGSFMHGTFYLTHWNHVIAKMQIRGKKLFLNTRVQKSDTDEFFDYVFPLSLTNEVNSITSIQLDCTGNDYYIPADSTITLYKMST